MAYLGSYKSQGHGGDAVAITKSNYKEKRMMNRRKVDAPQGTPFNQPVQSSSKSSSQSAPSLTPAPVPVSNSNPLVTSSGTGAPTPEVDKNKNPFTASFADLNAPTVDQDIKNDFRTGFNEGMSFIPAPTQGDVPGALSPNSVGRFAGNILSAVTLGELGAVKSAVMDDLAVGKLSVTNPAKGTPGMMSTNTASVKMTGNWLDRMFASSEKTVSSFNPKTGKTVTKIITTSGKAISTETLKNAFIPVIGSYPFAGFVKEEALQTLGFAVSAAKASGDMQGEQDAIDMQNALLDPNVESQIKMAIPWVNVIDQLNNFYKAARLKTAIDQKSLDDRKIQLETGETEDEKWARIRQEKLDQEEADRLADELYYANIARLEAEAKAAERKADEEYWTKILADSEARAQKKKDEQDEYWSMYYKSLAEASKTTTTTSGSSYEPPSKLNFGLI